MILVTGATGNVGSEITCALAARGESVRVLARNPDQASFPAGVQVAMGDLEDPDPSPRRSTPSARCSYSAAACVLRRIRAAGAGHVVQLTSRCVIGGNPQNAVTRMWLDAEAAVRDSGASRASRTTSGRRITPARPAPGPRSHRLRPLAEGDSGPATIGDTVGLPFRVGR